MPRIEHRVPQNVVGKFYVEWTCIYCDLCVTIAPTIFKEHHEQGWAYVFHQPVSPEEVELTKEAVQGCPTDSIGKDGDLFDWSIIPPEQEMRKERPRPPANLLSRILAKLL
jgi:ferredoxin